MKVQALATKRMESKHQHRRLTLRDMAIIKLDQSILNSKAKRGLIAKPEHTFKLCGCGMEGCFVPVMSHATQR